MTLDIDEMLAARADSVEPPRFDPQVVLAHGERLVTRRRRRTTALAACALVAVAGITVLTAPGADERVSPVQPSDPTRTTEPGARPLGYALGRVLHLGPLEVDPGFDFVSIDLVDEGAALTELDGTIWFTDGAEVTEIGRTYGREPGKRHWNRYEGAPREWVVSDHTGSLLAWIVPPESTRGSAELVVYDVGVRTEVARAPVEAEEGRGASMLAIAGRAVFVGVDYRGQTPLSPEEILRFDVDDSTFAVADESAYQQAIREVPRSLVIGTAELGDVLGTSDGEHGHLVHPDDIGVMDSQFRRLVDPDTGKLVDIALPKGGPSMDKVWFGQWLDDDRFTVATSSAMWVCQIAAAQCRPLLEGDFLMDLGTAVLLPGDGSIGADAALVRAERSARAAD